MQKCDLLYLNLKEYCELYSQLSQSASLFPCVQKCIWHQPTGLSCKAFCTIKIGLILRYTPFVFPTYKNTPFVRPNTFGQMGCCSFRGAPCFCFAFNLLTNGSRLRFSSISPGRRSESNPHSPVGHSQAAVVVVAVQVLLSAVTAEEGVYSEINQQQSSR